jgi:hypothetical protein
MIIARIVQVKYRVNGDHTVDFAKFGETIARKDAASWSGTVEMTLADDKDDAAIKLSTILREHLLRCRPKADLSAFTFDFRYTEVEESGRVWHGMNGLSDGHKIATKDSPHLEILECQVPPVKKQPRSRTSGRKSQPA